MSSSEPRPPATPDDALPPVQPPDAGFLVQLFVIPGVIVLIILAVWGGIHWLASSAQDPESFVRALSRPTSGRWSQNPTHGPEGKRSSVSVFGCDCRESC